jgi:hypothetical protein
MCAILILSLAAALDIVEGKRDKPSAPMLPSLMKSRLEICVDIINSLECDFTEPETKLLKSLD